MTHQRLISVQSAARQWDERQKTATSGEGFGSATTLSNVSLGSVSVSGANWSTGLSQGVSHAPQPNGVPPLNVIAVAMRVESAAASPYDAFGARGGKRRKLAKRHEG